jgi:hypothetical protein
MSSQWKDPGRAEEALTGAVWAASVQDEASAAAPPGRLDFLAPDRSAPAFSALEDADTTGLDEFPASRIAALWLWIKQVSPFLLPLLCAGLTFLVLVPLALQGKAYLSHAGLLPAALILLAIAILQGVMLYYAADHPVLWWLAFACGLALFLVAGSFALFGPLIALILLVLLVLGGLVLLRYALHPVPEGYVDIVFAWGSYRRTLLPGPNFVWPWEQVVQRLNTRLTQWTSPLQLVHLSPDEDVQLAATIAYQLMPEDAYLAVTEVNDWETSLQRLFLATIQAVVSSFSATYFIARPAPRFGAAEDLPGWETVNRELEERMQDQVATWGVQIHGVHIHDVALLPRGAVAPDTGAMEVPNAAPAAAAKSEQAAEEPASKAPKAAPASPAHADPPPAAPAAPSGTPPKVVKEDILVSTYNAVREGRISDPETIRMIAARFEAIASDPELSKTVSFDAERAARALRQRAELILAQQAQMQAYAPQYADRTELERPGGGEGHANATWLG